ncbi:MAG: protein kinase [Planctomycetes bacterium]|nr:protein kinase [Planctomycetota bacterium]
MSAEGMPRVADFPGGTVLSDRFDLRELLGAGNFGAVYRARQLVFGRALREVALKLFEAESPSSRNLGEVLSDVVTLVSFQETEKCPADVAQHLVQVHDMGVLETPLGKRAFVAMKLVPGRKTLKSPIARWSEAGMPVETALGFLRQILVPLAWMHTLEVPAVHGDLHPGNLILVGESHLVLTDFGLAARMPVGSKGGVVTYQAPETLLGGAGGPPADVYQTGILLYEMLTGRQPFEEAGLEEYGDGDSQGYVRAQHEARKRPVFSRGPRGGGPLAGGEGIPPPSAINPEMEKHPALEAMLRRCLAFRQSERYPNARTLLSDLDAYRRGGAVPPAAPPPPPPEAAAREPPETRIANARALLERGEAAKAAALARSVAAEHPRFLKARLLLVECCLQLGRGQEALDTCEAAQSVFPDEPEVFLAMADAYEALGFGPLAGSLRENARKLQGTRPRSPQSRN